MSEPKPIPNILVKSLLLLMLSSILLYLVYRTLYVLGFLVWPVSGIVLDEETNKPIPDATVVVNWKGHFFNTVLLHGEITHTNKRGRYSTPFRWSASRRSITDGRYDVASVYKPGYVESDKTYIFLSQENNEYYLKQFVAKREQYLKYLGDFPRFCGDGTDSREMCLELSNNIYTEAYNKEREERIEQFIKKNFAMAITVHQNNI